MNTTYAESNDIVALWRPFTTEEAAIVDAAIEQASRKLRSEVPRVDAIIAADTTGDKAGAAKDAVVNAVIRRFQNSDGILEFTIDDYRARRDASVSTGKLYIDRGDLRAFRRRGGGFGTIRLKAGM